jgi:hypothetical protein
MYYPEIIHSDKIFSQRSSESSAPVPCPWGSVLPLREEPFLWAAVYETEAKRPTRLALLNAATLPCRRQDSKGLASQEHFFFHFNILDAFSDKNDKTFFRIRPACRILG